MISSKLLVTGPTIRKEIERYSKLHVSEYTTTIYDKNGKLLDDGIDLETDKTYWESFIDPKQAAELERRLAMIEVEGFDIENAGFLPMEDDDD
jgi:hypothetical protein